MRNHVIDCIQGGGGAIDYSDNFDCRINLLEPAFKGKAIYNRLAHIHLPLVDLYSSILCLEEVPIVKCNKSWSSEKLSISINISTEWLAKIHFDIWEYKFYEKDCRCSARN